jgi:hypothetical protein
MTEQAVDPWLFYAETQPDDLVAQDLRDLFAERVRPVATILFGPDAGRLTELVRDAAERWITELREAVDTRDTTIRQLALGLFPSAPPEPFFWGRPFGRFVMASVGHWIELVPVAQVSDMFGLSRQAVYLAVQRGDMASLKQCNTLFIQRGSIRARYRAQGRKGDHREAA